MAISPSPNEVGYWASSIAWILENKIGDFASILGVAISIVGFCITIAGIKKTKNAAESAQQAAESTRDNIRLLETIVDFSSAITILEEIKRRHREPPSELLLERYSTLRKLLVTIRAGYPNLTDQQQTAIQGAIANLSAFEKRVERSLSESIPAPKFNALISDDIDSLVEVLTQVKASRSGVEK